VVTQLLNIGSVLWVKSVFLEVFLGMLDQLLCSISYTYTLLYIAVIVPLVRFGGH